MSAEEHASTAETAAGVRSGKPSSSEAGTDAAQSRRSDVNAAATLATGRSGRAMCQKSGHRACRVQQANLVQMHGEAQGRQ
jgi:hypothetical protein